VIAARQERVKHMSEPTDDKLPRDVHELLLSRNEEEGHSTMAQDVVTDARRPKREKFFSVPMIVILVSLALTAVGLGVIYASPVLSEQFSAMLSGDLGKYKEQLRKVREDKVREIESVTGNRYGSLSLFYSPRTARVTITEYKYKLDCSKSSGDDETLACLRKKVDYSQKPEILQVDNPSLKLKDKEVVEQIPLNDIPIKEASDDRKTLFVYDMTVVIEADGYYPRKFFLTGDKEHGRVEDGWESMFWEQKGPQIWMVDFRGADLLPKPETARENYKKALNDWECIKREIDTKRKGGKNVSEDTESGLFIEILNRNGFKTFEEFNAIDVELRKDDKFAKEFDATLKKVECK
jgi:hypothetical protein